MTLAYISHRECELHDMGAGHPERPERLRAITDHLASCGLEAVLDQHEAPPVSRDLLDRAHDAGYVEQIHQVAPKEGRIQLDGDTAMNPHSLGAALRAAGAVQLGVDLVMGGRAGKAFCAVRPPGHHAECHRAMGFCLFNNIVIGALHALEHHRLERVAVVDFDVHHGNGTEDIVSGDDRILFCSTFQHPFYPNTGVDCQAGNVVNTPLPAGAGGDEFRRVVEMDWLPRLEAFAPQLILVSAGFDAHAADRMAGLNFTEADYSWVTQELCKLAGKTAHGRIVSSLEGGYELGSLARSVEAHLRVLLDHS